MDTWTSLFEVNLLFLVTCRAWFWNQELPQFFGGQNVLVDYCRLNVKLQSLHEIHYPEKELQTLCEIAVGFLHTQLTKTNVLLPKIHETPLEVNFESSRSPNSESWNKPNCAEFPAYKH